MRRRIPNILFIMSDDHAANAISAYGSRLAAVFKTPNLDRIAREGARFDHFYCTNAICTPSRATILTGKYSHSNGVKTLEDCLAPSLETYPEKMKNQGYQTAVVGKWHVHCQPRGFHYYDVLPGQGKYFDPFFMDEAADWEAYIRHPHNEEQGKQHKGYVTDVITDKCIRWLESRDRSKPFLLMCHHKAPHDFFEYPSRHAKLLEGTEIPEPESLWEDKSHRSEGSREYGTTVSEKNGRRNMVDTVQLAAGASFCPEGYPNGVINLMGMDPVEKTKAAYQKYLKDYLRCVNGIDDSVGRLLDYLDREGLVEETVVIYTSDQGMFLGEHDYIDKRWIYEEALQMPFLMRYPAEIKAGTQIVHMVSNVDIAPTLLDYAQAEDISDAQGRSFRGVARGNPPPDWPDILYYRYWMHMAHHDNPAHYGIRTKEYKLICFYGLPLDASGALPVETPLGWELYDLANDPQELKNVYDAPAYAEITRELKSRLTEMKKSIGDEDECYGELVEKLNRG